MNSKLWVRLLVISIVFALIYAVMLTVLARSLEAMDAMPAFSRRGGPLTLFCMLAGLLGWVVHYIADHAIETVGPLTMTIVCIACGVAIGLGTLLGISISTSPPESAIQLGLCCFVLAVGVGAFRSVFES